MMKSKCFNEFKFNKVVVKIILEDYLKPWVLHLNYFIYITYPPNPTAPPIKTGTVMPNKTGVIVTD